MYLCQEINLLQISAKEGARKTRVHYTCMIEIRWFDLSSPFVSPPDDITLFRKRRGIASPRNHPSLAEILRDLNMEMYRKGQISIDARVTVDSHSSIRRRNVLTTDLRCVKNTAVIIHKEKTNKHGLRT